MSSFHQRGIASQRGDGLSGVAPHPIRHMRLQGTQARPHPRIHDVNAAFEILPEPLDRMQCGAIGRQPDEDDVLGPLDALGDMRRGLVQQDDVETLRIMLGKFVQKKGKAGGIQAGQFPPKRVARGGFDRGREPVRFVEWLDNLYRFDPAICEPTADGQVEPEATFLLAEEPYRLVGRLPAEGGNGAQTARALFDQVRGLSNVFFAWLGRGRFSCALS
jgi:hypothetical protein